MCKTGCLKDMVPLTSKEFRDFAFVSLDYRVSVSSPPLRQRSVCLQSTKESGQRKNSSVRLRSFRSPMGTKACPLKDIGFPISLTQTNY